LKFSHKDVMPDLSMRHRFASLAALATVLSFTACREAKVAHYRVPKEKAPELPPGMSANPGGDMASTAVPTAQGAGLTWTAPADWKAKAASAMRRGSYDVKGADLSITAFPGDVGGELANLNRWRGQIQLPPLTADELPSATTTLKVGSLDFIVVDFAGTSAENPQRILGALVSFDDNTWFFKLMGPDAVVAAAKPAFLDFLQSVKTPAAGAAAPTDMASTAVPTAQGDGLTWTAPAHWETKASSAMRRGSYAVTGIDGASADMSITAFPGDVGGELANLNRWRGQILLPPLSESALSANTTTLKVGSLDFTVVDFTSTTSSAPERILGALVSFEGNTWFFKLKGPAQLVEANKSAFLQLLQSVKTP
jgi:hypothetical protein